MFVHSKKIFIFSFIGNGIWSVKVLIRTSDSSCMARKADKFYAYFILCCKS